MFEDPIPLLLEPFQQVAELSLPAPEFVLQVAQPAFGQFVGVFEQRILQGSCALLFDLALY